ncbi:zinc finger CCCH domain-containing protein 2-like [Lolium rigidum]|uniref:zinc finger CCCH domain-containing protein 2-like n=1 Tax=Lolium rigidum TaxID=89674 RepID=UPI001F5D6D7A|nr:zinc finger CCCH domain-containing protein 2-like [Lolium rigidum]
MDRRVCFFVHTPDQLRSIPAQHAIPRNSTPLSPLAESYDGSPLRRQAFETYLTGKSGIMSSSPTSTLLSSTPKSPPSESPPMSPDALRRGSWPGVGSPGVNDVMASLHQLRLSKAQSSPSGGWTNSYHLSAAAAYGSPKGGGGLYSLPTTPMATSTPAATFMANLEPLNLRFMDDDEPVQRVESGRALREKVFERLSRDGAVSGSSCYSAGPDVGWVSDLIN